MTTKHQTYALAVARRVEHLHPAAKACNDVTERYLNGTVTKEELKKVADSSRHGKGYAGTAAFCAGYAALNPQHDRHYAEHTVRVALSAVEGRVYSVRDAVRAEAATAAEREAQVEIFKTIFKD